jgi:hypothetical protein
MRDFEKKSSFKLLPKNVLVRSARIHIGTDVIGLVSDIRDVPAVLVLIYEGVSKSFRIESITK